VTIQDLGNIGELIAAVATIATLLYLARQLRANTAAVQGDARRANRAASTSVNIAIASDPEVAALLNAGLRDFAALSPEQHTQSTFLMAEIFRVWGAAHEEFESGLVGKEFLEGISDAHRTFLKAPGGREWWSRYRSSIPPSFRDFVDSEIERLDRG
jgi:hypothetical protein